MAATLGLFISQILIANYWQDAKFGTIANAVILLAAIVGYGKWTFSKKYENDVNAALMTMFGKWAST